eukprot:scaffold174975_cov45-Prasinocladus_malaysianus.AAC.1
MQMWECSTALASNSIADSKLTEIGQVSNEPLDTVYDLQYLGVEGKTITAEQWHLNGIDSFRTLQGLPLVAITLKDIGQAVIFTDPWAFEQPAIVQRFGTGPVFNLTEDFQPVSYDYFGLDDAEGYITSLHNVFYNCHANGTETLTIFVNRQLEVPASEVIEFRLNPYPEDQLTGSKEAPLFPTSYQKAVLDFDAWVLGGARPIGQGLYLISKGYSLDGDEPGFEVADSAGSTLQMPYLYDYSPPLYFYDPFVWIDLPSATPLEDSTAAPAADKTDGLSANRRLRLA